MIEKLRGYLRKRENRLHHPDKPFTHEYWLDLPNRFPPVATSMENLNRCDLWSEAALKAVESDGYSGIFERRVKYDTGRSTWLWDTFQVWQHQFLEASKDGKRYIADGTVGQFFEEETIFSTGYFGDVENAPPNLQAIYNYNEE